MAWRSLLSKNCKEIRVLFCPTSPSSATTRQFIERNYTELKTLNPKFPILIRECSQMEPQLWVRYDKGVEQSHSLETLTEDQITSVLKNFINLGEAIKKAQQFK